MRLNELPFIQTYLDYLSRELSTVEGCCGLSSTQRRWLGICLLGILLTNQVCWASFERVNLQSYKARALSWMFRHSKLNWNWLLMVSVQLILRYYGIKAGHLVIDDTDNPRSKGAKLIYKVSKHKDKKTGGYFKGQQIVFLVLVSEVLTLVVGFRFYAPDPVYKAWEKKDKDLRKKGIKKKRRPPVPARDANYPTKVELALSLLRDFAVHHPTIRIKGIEADALYGTAAFMDTASQIFFAKVQVLSQIRSNQKVVVGQNAQDLDTYFATRPLQEVLLYPRGATQPVRVYYKSGCVKVQAHNKKRLVIAMKYEGEENFRYIIARDMSWRVIDLLHAYTLRWFVEVFIQDWKGVGGWANLTKHTGEDGSRRALILSLLFDHSLFFHPRQIASIKQQLVAFTVASLHQHCRMEARCQLIQDVLQQDDPNAAWQRLVKNIDYIVPLKPSKKHLVGKDVTIFDKKAAA